MSTRNVMLLLGLGVGGFLLYQWWKQQPVTAVAALNPANVQSTLDQITASDYSAQARRLDDQLVLQGGTPGIL